MVRRVLFLLGIICRINSAFAQEKQVDGIVYDAETKERIAIVNIVNTRSKISLYNNLKAEFHVNARQGDKLIFSKLYYFNDTITVKGNGPLLVYLKQNTIMLRQVNIRDTAVSPKTKLAAVKRDYSKIYGSLDNHDYLTTAPFGGAGIGIDAIWNALSKSGRNAAHLRTIIERDYHDNLVDYRFNKTLVAGVTGLKDPKLTDFMQKYRPGYYLTITASDYDFILSIKNNYRRYMRNPRAFTLPKLPNIPVNNDD